MTKHRGFSTIEVRGSAEVVCCSPRENSEGTIAHPEQKEWLAIVSDLAELYGGSVTLETSPLGGTRARLQLPRL